jgi:hypothetical protein
MATIAWRRRERYTEGPGVARRGLWTVARLVSLAVSIVVGILVIGIALVLLEANRGNEVVDWVLDAGRFLAEPFDNVFKPDGEKARIGVNWGLAALIYAVVGGFVVRLLQR